MTPAVKLGAAPVHKEPEPERVPVGSLVLWVHQLKQVDFRLENRLDEVARDQNGTAAALRTLEQRAKQASGSAQTSQSTANSAAKSADTAIQLARNANHDIEDLQKKIASLEKRLVLQYEHASASQDGLKSRIDLLEGALERAENKLAEMPHVCSDQHHHFPAASSRVIPCSEQTQQLQPKDPGQTQERTRDESLPRRISAFIKSNPGMFQDTNNDLPALANPGQEENLARVGVVQARTSSRVRDEDEISTEDENSTSFDRTRNLTYSPSLDLGFASQHQSHTPRENADHEEAPVAKTAQKPRAPSEVIPQGIDQTNSNSRDLERDSHAVHRQRSPHQPEAVPDQLNALAPCDVANSQPTPQNRQNTSSQRLTRARTRGAAAPMLDKHLEDPESLLRSSTARRQQSTGSRSQPLRPVVSKIQSPVIGEKDTQQQSQSLRAPASGHASAQDLSRLNRHDLAARNFLKRALPRQGAGDVRNLFLVRPSDEQAAKRRTICKNAGQRAERLIKDISQRQEPTSPSSRIVPREVAPRPRQSQADDRCAGRPKHSRSPNLNVIFQHWQPKRSSPMDREADAIVPPTKRAKLWSPSAVSSLGGFMLGGRGQHQIKAHGQLQMA